MGQALRSDGPNKRNHGDVDVGIQKLEDISRELAAPQQMDGHGSRDAHTTVM